MSNIPEDPEKSLGDSHQALTLLRAGDVSAVAKLMASVRPFLKHQVQEILGSGRSRADDPSDLVQRALLQAVERAGTFQGNTLGEWRAWLVAIARNQAIDSHRYWRSGKRDTRRVATLKEDVVTSRDPSPSSQLIRSENAERLATAMAQLDESDRQIIQWQQLDGLTHAEMARRLEISEAASRQRLKTAFTRLRGLWRSLADD